MLCRIVGHQLIGTYVIEESEGFYEVDDAKYCARCGEVNPPETGKLLRYITSLL